MENFEDYYKILGVDFYATQQEIRKKYLQLIKENHPDTHAGEFYEARTKELNKAYEVLGNAENRRIYNVNYILHEEDMKRKEQQRHTNQQSQRTHQERVNTEHAGKFKTNRKESAKHSKRKVSNNSFFRSVVEDIKDVKKDESKYPFKERHRNLNKKLYRMHAKKNGSPNTVIFHIEQGVVHVSAEFLYQLSKLTYIYKDNVIKYVYRNRRLAETILLSIIIASCISGPKETTISAEPYEVAGVVVTETDEDEIGNITLIRNYTVEVGDSLSTLSDMSLTKIEDIKRANHFTTDMIYLGDVIKLPYEVSKEDLQYYTNVVDTNGMSLADLASLYETDEDTLYRLNEEAIGTVDGAHIIMTDKVLVPNFITSDELEARKEGNTKTYQ